ncbi:MAG: DUF736 family protein [Candidatus Thioglobus sp.]|nr:DUF736 family protein [Candidatus Thioglobus sp.]
MTQYDDTNRGVLFVQRDKKTEKHPDFTGKLDVEGKEYRVAGWKRVSQNGANFISVSIEEPRKPEDAPQAEAAEGDEGDVWG